MSQGSNQEAKGTSDGAGEIHSSDWWSFSQDKRILDTGICPN